MRALLSLFLALTASSTVAATIGAEYGTPFGAPKQQQVQSVPKVLRTAPAAPKAVEPWVPQGCIDGLGTGSQTCVTPLLEGKSDGSKTTIY